MSPAINSVRADELAAIRSIRTANPLPVVPGEDCTVEPQVLRCGNYDRACLNMQKDASGTYEYPTLVDHSVLNNFLKDDH
eukprot:15560496-Heterocapsa_arctica.AAC.1